MSRPRFEHFMYGYVFMEIRGARVQDVLGAMQKSGIRLYDVRFRQNITTVGICLRDFDAFLSCCRQHKVKIRFIRREGLPFAIRKLRRRKAMLLGFVLFFGVLYTLNGMIWQVSVKGGEDETQTAILQAARECGVFIGASKRSVADIERLQGNMLRKMPNLLWIGVQTDGSKVQFEPLEKVPESQKAETKPHNIVAGKPAVIRKVFANRGNVIVKPGQVVHPGDIVISGDLGPGAIQVPASGEVWAEVWYHTKIAIPLSVKQSALTGEFVVRDYLTMGASQLRVWGFEQPAYQAAYERDVTTDWRFGRWLLPVQLKKVTLYQAAPNEVAQSQEEAARQALQLAAQDVRTQMNGDGEILDQTVLQREVSHGKLYETILTKTEEDIGVPTLLAPQAPPTTANKPG